MNRKLITLMMVMLSIAFFQNAYAVEMSESGLVEIHGFITQGYIHTSDNNMFADTEDDGTTQFNEVGLNFSSDVSERLRLGVQFFARDLGKMGDMEVSIDWAFADYSFYDWLNLRAGKVKLPFALYNTERDVDILRTFVFLPQSFYFEGWRDSANALNGAGFYGYIPAGFIGNFEYQLYSGTSSVPADGGVARLLQDETPVWMDVDVTYVDVKYTSTGQMVWDSIFGLDGVRLVGGAWGIEFDAHCDYNNGSILPYFDQSGNPTGAFGMAKSKSTFNAKVFTYNGSMEVALGDFVFAAEYVKFKYNLTLPVDTTISSTGVVASKFDSLGYYGSLTYRFSEWLEGGMYYSEYYSDTDDKDGKKKAADYIASGGLTGLAPGMEHNQWSKDLCVSLRFDISTNWLFKLEGHKINGSALLYSDDGNVNAAGTGLDYEEDWYMTAAKLSFNF